jgi:mannitol-1-phosphate 5-dehydrogenase
VTTGSGESGGNPRLLQFGAGKIGRSFIGQLFSRAGYEVVFVDVADALVRALNERRSYRVVIKDVVEEEIWVEHVRAIHAGDTEAVAREIAGAAIAATAVGPAFIASVFPLLAAGLLRRRAANGGALDVIICENVLHGARLFRDGIKPLLPADYPFDDLVGLVETSIGKMVPLMPEAERDPLLVYAEAYNTLIVDRRAFKRGVPDVSGIEAKDNMAAYVDRKLFIHNLGHTVAAFLQYLLHPDQPYIWQAMADPEVRGATEAAMWESGRALIGRYPDEFNEANQREAIEDLLQRFANRALGDTVYRVGRDLPRKLSAADRFINALRMDREQNVDAPYTELGLAAGLLFRATDQQGRLFDADARFVAEVYAQGVNYVLQTVCGLNLADPADRAVAERVRLAHDFLADPQRRRTPWLAAFHRRGLEAFRP